MAATHRTRFLLLFVAGRGDESNQLSHPEIDRALRGEAVQVQSDRVRKICHVTITCLSAPPIIHNWYATARAQLELW